jgi:hypothetical protein
VSPGGAGSESGVLGVLGGTGADDMDAVSQEATGTL